MERRISGHVRGDPGRRQGYTYRKRNGRIRLCRIGGVGTVYDPTFLVARHARGKWRIASEQRHIPEHFSAPGLDLGSVYAEIGWNIPVSYQ